MQLALHSIGNVWWLQAEIAITQTLYLIADYCIKGQLIRKTHQ